MEEKVRISPPEAVQKLDAGQAIVLDVVSSPVWRRLNEAIPGAIRIPPEEFLQRMGELPREREIIAY
jgi:rhodanese-related sulfurtransferase